VLSPSLGHINSVGTYTCINKQANSKFKVFLNSVKKNDIIKLKIVFVVILQPLRTPLLYLASLTRRGRQSDVSEDVFNHCRDRYFPGEPVEAIVNKHWYDCKVSFLGV
jgi:hypothetical protein